MEWTKPLSFLLTVLVALFAIGAIVEIARTTLASDLTVASAVTLALVVVSVLVMVVVGARNRQWLKNPDSYW
ncbi:MAG: hypothetical protein ACI8UR_000099 [Natronomonas sp.]|jgi:lipopolysaccharide export LptBFGC system permease protein LptF|uniref:hypothetical protein n=1 Tax=Natronomonas sp. TaxID=2184060 RepID=UPI00398A175A